MKKLRLLLITLCVSVLMGSMAVTAYAGGMGRPCPGGAAARRNR